MQKKRRKSAQLEDPLGIVLEKYWPVTPFEEGGREREREGEREVLSVSAH
jgi:bisphosphoglycerate-independent phosphoglycerate mutase (AlkP superfamily)